MGRYDNDYYGYPPYVSKAEKIARAAKSRAKLAKKGVLLEPVIIEGRTIARTWWGQGWVNNLERYADYSNRLPRGRSYLRNGSILDLKIEKNRVTALVSGSRETPYKINIAIESLGRSRESELMTKSRSSLDSMQALLSGEFPEDLKEDFFKKESGLFPSPKEIKLDCSCPDWASMCKHVAAALYGVAVRLDQKPELFFILRGIDINSFVAKAAKEETVKLLQKADVESNRVIAEADSDDEMGALFGISFEPASANPLSTVVPVETVSPVTNGNRVKKVVKKSSSKVAVKKTSSNTKLSKIKKSEESAEKLNKKKPVKKTSAKKASTTRKRTISDITKKKGNNEKERNRK